MNGLRLIGGTSATLDEEIPFGSCTFPDVTFDSNEVKYKSDVWKNWKDNPFECNLGIRNATKIQSIHAKVCKLPDAGSSTQLEAWFQIGKENNQQCKQDLTGTYYNGNYKTTPVTNCTHLDVGGNDLKLWIINPAETDGLCLQDVYVDVSNEGKFQLMK